MDGSETRAGGMDRASVSRYKGYVKFHGIRMASIEQAAQLGSVRRFTSINYFDFEFGC